MDASGQKREGEAPPAGEQPPSKKPTLEGQAEPTAAMDATDSSDSDDAGGRPSGPAGGSGEEGGERQWMVAGGPKAVRIGDDYQVSLPPLVAAAPPAVPAQEGNGAAAGGPSRASEFHDGTVDFDEDGLGSGTRMYQ